MIFTPAMLAQHTAVVDAYIQRLRTRQLVTIENRGEVRASDNLF